MKMLIGILSILLVFNIASGQAFIRTHSSIERTPTGNNTIEDAIYRTNSPNGDYSWIQDVHFIKDGKLYLLAYEPKSNSLLGGERDIFLYSKDTGNFKNPWIKASDVVMKNYISADIKNFRDVDFHEKRFNGSVGEVVVENDCVKVTIDVEIMENGNFIHDTKPLTITFKPDRDGFYIVTGVPSNYLIGASNDNSSSPKEVSLNKEVTDNPSNNTAKKNDCFSDDNLALTKVIELRRQFLDGINQTPYSTYSNHTYSLNFNAPYFDEERGYEPTGVFNGYKRGYFINSEDVFIQQKVENNVITEVIYFHPNGKIYNIVKVVNEKPNGLVKYVDLDNYVILEGTIKDGKMIGFWNTPVLGHFDTQNINLINQYPGVMNQMLTLINFYRYNKDNRIFNMN